MTNPRGPRAFRPSRVFMGSLSHGEDLLAGLTSICRQEELRSGRIEGLGAVSKANLGFYDQERRTYRSIELASPLEILSLKGNISLKEGEPFVHAHLTLSDASGRAFGGHLALGTVVFAFEYVIEAWEGPVLERRFDETTGLFLWEGGGGL